MTSEDVYKRLLLFATRINKLNKSLAKNASNREYGEQLIRSSASPGANYIEALEASSRKDFTYRLKVCRKEARESIYWLALLQTANEDNVQLQNEIAVLSTEANELVRIFTASILSLEKNKKW